MPIGHLPGNETVGRSLTLPLNRLHQIIQRAGKSMTGDKDNAYQYQPLWGKWYIELPLGQGSFGTVYKISCEEMGYQYESAVKVITIPSEEQYRDAKASLGNDEDTLTSYFEDIVRNIVGEINMLYSLSGNSNIVGYQDHQVIKKKDTMGWDVLIRMELVTSLPKYLESQRFSREQVVQLGLDICTALELCSKKGIIHRDIKDENIFISKDGLYKLGDFGIAKELSGTGRAASMRGTPLYMAPEVYRGEKYDAAVDIYSLGIVLYKLLNGGRMPFMPSYPQQVKSKDCEDALERRIAGEQLPPPAYAGEELGAIVLKACSHKPENRYASAAEMKQALERVLVSMGAAERAELVTPEKTRKTEPPTFVTAPSTEGEPTASDLQAEHTVGVFETDTSSSTIHSQPHNESAERTIGISDCAEREAPQPQSKSQKSVDISNGETDKDEFSAETPSINLSCRKGKVGTEGNNARVKRARRASNVLFAIKMTLGILLVLTLITSYHYDYGEFAILPLIIMLVLINKRKLVDCINLLLYIVVPLILFSSGCVAAAVPGEVYPYDQTYETISVILWLTQIAVIIASLIVGMINGRSNNSKYNV